MKKKTEKALINIGTGKDMKISEFAKIIMKYFKVNLKLTYNKSMPDGVKRKLLDVRLSNKLGWKYKTDLMNGIDKTYKDFLKNHSKKL